MEAKQVILLGLALTALGSQPAVVDGQQATTDTVFLGGERSAVLSGVLEYFPTLGFAYAGDWKRGFLPNAFRVASFIGAAVYYDPLGNESNSDTALAVWVSAVVATSVWAVVGAVNTAKDHNTAVRARRTQPSVAPAPFGGVSVGLRLLH